MLMMLILFNVLFPNIDAVHGRLSYYAPDDGFNSGNLACGGKFTEEQNHVAVRDWHLRGCKRRVLVCAKNTERCVLSRVRDAGPFGIIKGKLRHAVREKRWKVWTKLRPPKGWRFRAIVDLSVGLWKKLGKPAPLSKITLIYVKR